MRRPDGSWPARAAELLRASLVEKVPRDHHEPDSAFARRRRVVGATSLAGASLLGVSLSTRPGSWRFYASALGVAATWTAGAAASGPLHLGRLRGLDDDLHRPVAVPVLTGAAAFGVFYGVALVARRVPVLDDALTRVLAYAHQGDPRLVLATTLANGAAEELFFRGALYAAVGERHPVALSTVTYAVTTLPTRNPALVLAATVMGALFGLQRRASGGVQAPLLTHLTWSTLMLRHLPPLFPGEPRPH